MDKPTIALITAVWKRPELTGLVLNRFKNIKFELSNKINLELIAVGSEGDASRRLCESRGFFYVEYENVPLNRKYNAACRTAKQFDPDAVFRIDSDDWITGDIFDRYLEILKNGVDAVGLLDIYFLDLSDFKLGKWDGYGFFNNKVDRYEAWRRKLKGRTHGVARCFSRRLMEKINWELWDEELELNSGLDRNCDKRLKRHGFKIKGFKMKELNIFAVDIKGGGTNISENTFGKLKLEMIKNPDQLLYSFFSETEINDLKQLNNIFRNRIEIQND
jgi:hypothetical protein|tara:strand:- start:3021 stop:3845 length:825 start_codon:yes stop_codon:yes gene_type:complete